MIVMGIETSCDDTSVAIINDGKLLSNAVYSQTVTHEKFGGVVPELASRDHIRKLSIVADKAISDAGLKASQIEGVSVTCKPGLIGALFVGVSFAKSFAYYNNIPFVGINHLAAHLYAIYLEKEVDFPFMGLTVSGGHTSITHVTAFSEEKKLGITYDDAAGEAFDKVAKILGLGYPGGPLLEKLGKQGDPKAIDFPRPLLASRKAEDRYNFSFSGLKSAVVNYLNQNPEANKADVAASFQEAVVDILSKKLYKAARDHNCDNIVIAGGVACNGTLRERMYEVFKQKRFKVHVPSPKFCTDNAAMVAYIGSKYLEMGKRDDITLGASSRV